MNATSDYPLREMISYNPQDADAKGYSRSKWCAESLIKNASKALRNPMKIIRVGQLTGDTERGVWNASEAWPMMLSTAFAVRCLPELEQTLDWLPLDVAAGAVIEITKRTCVEVEVYHVLNGEESKTWKDMLRWLRELDLVDFEIVPLELWITKVEALGSHPAMNLLCESSHEVLLLFLAACWCNMMMLTYDLAGLWKEAYAGQSANHKDVVSFDTHRAKRAAKSLRQWDGVSKELIEKIMTWVEKERIGDVGGQDEAMSTSRVRDAKL